MFENGVAKGSTIDKIGETYCISRLRFKTIPLLLGWKLIKEEKDKEYKGRILKKIQI